MKIRLPAILKVLGALLIIAVLVYRLDNRAALGAAAGSAIGRPGWLLAGAALFGLSLGSFYFRWRALLRGLEVPLGRGTTLRLILLGHAGNLLLPGGAGGDLVKAGYLVRDCPGKRAAALFSLVLDRVTGLFWMMALVVGATLWGWSTFARNRPLMWILALNAAGVAATVALTLWLRSRPETSTAGPWPFGRVLRRQRLALRDAARFVCRHPGILRDTALFSLSNHISQVFSAWCMLRAIGVPLSAAAALRLLPVANLVTMLPLTPGALGLREFSFQVILDLAGVPAAEAMTAGLLLYGVMLAWALATYPFLWLPARR